MSSVASAARPPLRPTKDSSREFISVKISFVSIKAQRGFAASIRFPGCGARTGLPESRNQRGECTGRGIEASRVPVADQRSSGVGREEAEGLPSKGREVVGPVRSGGLAAAERPAFRALAVGPLA